MRKKEYIGCLIVLLLMYAWVLPGCGTQGGVFYEAAKEKETGGGEKETPLLTEETDGKGASDAGTVSEGSGQSYGTVSEGNGQSHGAVSEGNGQSHGTVSDGAGGDTKAFGSEERDAGDAAGVQPACYIHICGAVINPGVYEVPEGSRLYEVIVLAGGLCADACDYLVNQAQTVGDGMQIYIPTMQEVQNGTAGREVSAGNTTSGAGTSAGQSGTPGAGTSAGQNGTSGTGMSAGQNGAGSADTRVNINNATKEQLMTLPGVGETRAQAIIDYREQNGAFASVEDLMKVSGIKQGVYDRLKDWIKV